ncbi:DUF6932 family protein [Staphylococcus chromogenes]|uniref:DUF6932 family protein n=1 Tax=Staphylococcus chromogenes TaxID=46126 RepID=UPI002888856F|nr:hypothetical protein [Staphylococcus chromogenes]MDT0747122.1 hypothetical protein [Staphylococcus chromogenes]
MIFDDYGNLKGDIIDSNIIELKGMLVDNVPNTKHRKKLYSNFLNMFDDEIIKVFTESVTKLYIDGSFCTSKEYPGDIDILALIDLRKDKGLQLASDKNLKDQLRCYIKEKYNVDFLCTPDSGTLDKNIEQYSDIYLYLKRHETGWIEFFSTDRNDNKKALIRLHMYEEV